MGKTGRIETHDARTTTRSMKLDRSERDLRYDQRHSNNRSAMKAPVRSLSTVKPVLSPQERVDLLQDQNADLTSQINRLKKDNNALTVQLKQAQKTIQELSLQSSGFAASGAASSSSTSDRRGKKQSVDGNKASEAKFTYEQFERNVNMQRLLISGTTLNDENGKAFRFTAQFSVDTLVAEQEQVVQSFLKCFQQLEDEREKLKHIVNEADLSADVKTDLGPFGKAVIETAFKVTSESGIIDLFEIDNYDDKKSCFPHAKPAFKTLMNKACPSQHIGYLTPGLKTFKRNGFDNQLLVLRVENKDGKCNYTDDELKELLQLLPCVTYDQAKPEQQNLESFKDTVIKHNNFWEVIVPEICSTCCITADHGLPDSSKPCRNWQSFKSFIDKKFNSKHNISTDDKALFFDRDIKERLENLGITVHSLGSEFINFFIRVLDEANNENDEVKFIQPKAFMNFVLDKAKTSWTTTIRVGLENMEGGFWTLFNFGTSSAETLFGSSSNSDVSDDYDSGAHVLSLIVVSIFRELYCQVFVELNDFMQDSDTKSVPEAIEKMMTGTNKKDLKDKLHIALDNVRLDVRMWPAAQNLKAAFKKWLPRKDMPESFNYETLDNVCYAWLPSSRIKVLLATLLLTDAQSCVHWDTHQLGMDDFVWAAFDNEDERAMVGNLYKRLEAQVSKNKENRQIKRIAKKAKRDEDEKRKKNERQAFKEFGYNDPSFLRSQNMVARNAMSDFEELYGINGKDSLKSHNHEMVVVFRLYVNKKVARDKAVVMTWPLTIKDLRERVEKEGLCVMEEDENGAFVPTLPDLWVYGSSTALAAKKQLNQDMSDNNNKKLDKLADVIKIDWENGEHELVVDVTPNSSTEKKNFNTEISFKLRNNATSTCFVFDNGSAVPILALINMPPKEQDNHVDVRERITWPFDMS